MKFLAKEYKFRADLESVILSMVGGNIEKNRDANPAHSIEGTRAELERLQLDDRTSIYGIHCVITDDTTEKRVKAKNL